MQNTIMKDIWWLDVFIQSCDNDDCVVHEFYDRHQELKDRYALSVLQMTHDSIALT
jgi:hypothetical protein